MMGWYGGAMSPLGLPATGVIWLFLLGLTVWLLAWLLSGGSNEKASVAAEAPA